MGEDDLAFFRQLFCPEGADAEGYISMFFLKRPSTHTTRQFRSGDVQDAIACAQELASEGYDCYYSPAVLREPVASGRGRKTDFIGARVLWVDLDATPEKPKETILAELEAFSPKPSVIVDSGHGLHVYWYLDHLETDHGSIERRNLWLANQLGGDHCHSVDHVLRVPGTFNYKAAHGRSTDTKAS